ncbi:MAG: ABC transporter substrate-binding protein [Treponema sp.]|jgi:iron complex transport system substrate-binding protein|nr:ABC transporter substrate-binding protein [Treponema sp.]
MGAALSVLLAALCCLSCGGREKGETGAAGADGETANLYWNIVTRDEKEYVTDRAGNAAALETYRRIILISPGAVETLYLLGAEEAIAAISSGRDPVWPEDKTSLLPSVGNAARPNLEAVMALEPDLVIGNAMNAAFIADLAARDYRVLIHGADSMEDIFNSTLILGRLTGKTEAAEALTARTRDRFTRLRGEIQKDRPALKGAFLYSVNPIMAFTGASLAGEILTVLGIENIAAGLDAAQPILSAEFILDQDPDFLFGAMSITKKEDILAADSVIPRTRAGREGNIRIVPSSLFLRPSPRIIETLTELHREVRAYER